MGRALAGPRDVQYRILGPVEAARDGVAVELGGAKQRALLALLLVHRDEVVSTDRLVDALWGEEAPGTGRKALQVHVSRLRRAVAGAALETRSTGYLLHVPDGCLDLDTFHELVRRATAAGAQGRLDQAGDLFRRAELEWRGPALADAGDSADLAAAASRLEQERRHALEERIEADLAVGRYADVVPELEALVAADPLRERPQAQLMRALYASGRQADALARFQSARRVTIGELGLEPGPQLRELEQAILRQDPDLPTQALQPPPAGPAGTTRRLARPALGLLAAVALAALALSTTVVHGGDRDEDPPRGPAASSPPDTGPDHLVEIDPGTNRVLSSAAVGSEPGSLAATPGAIWVSNFGDRTVSRLELLSRRVRNVGGAPVALHLVSTTDGDVWLSSFTEPVVTLLAEDGGIVSPVPDSALLHVPLPGPSEALAVGGGYLWVTSPSDTGGRDQVFQVDLGSRRVVQAIPVGRLPLYVCVGYGAAWVANYKGDSVSVIRPGQSRADTVAVSAGPLGIAAGEGGVWVAAYWKHELVRLDPDTLAVVDTIDIGAEPLGVAVGAGSVWVASRGDHVVERIDPARGTVVARIRVHSAPQEVVVADGHVWVTTQ